MKPAQFLLLLLEQAITALVRAIAFAQFPGVDPQAESWRVLSVGLDNGGGHSAVELSPLESFVRAIVLQKEGGLADPEP
jgi:hypothetical protein